MSRVVVLDAGQLGLVSNPRPTSEALACTRWLYALIDAGVRVVIPEITDYEVRRELLRANRLRGVTELDRLANTLDYLPLTTNAMRQAADCWAQARQQGRPTADDRTIDADMILAGQVLTCGVPLADVQVATTNLRHLARFVPAAEWTTISLA